MKKKLTQSLFTLFFTLYTFYSFGQSSENKIPDLLDHVRTEAHIDTIYNLIKQKVFSLPGQMLVHSQQLILHAEELNYQKGIADANHLTGAILIHLGQYEEALDYLNIVLKLREQLNDKGALGQTHHNIAIVYNNKHQYGKAVFHFLEAIAYIKEVGKKATLGNAYVSLGIFHKWTLNNHSEAILYLKEGERIFEEINDTFQLATSRYNLALVLLDNSNSEKAKQYLEWSLEVFQKRNDKKYIALALNTLGGMHVEDKAFSLSLEKLNKAQRIFTEIQLTSGLSENHIYFAHYYRALGDFETALMHDKTALTLSQKLNDNTGKLNAYNGLYRNHKGLDNLKNALTAYENFHILNDSMHNEEQEILSSTLSRFKTQEKDFKIEQLENEATLNHQRIVILCVTLGFLAFLAFLFFSKQRSLRKKDLEIFRQKQEVLTIKEQVKEAKIQQYKREAKAHTQSLVEKNELIEKLNDQLVKLSNIHQPEKEEAILELSKLHILTDSDWDKFKLIFERGYPGFLENLRIKIPNLTASERRLFILMKMNLSINQISSMLGISKDSVRKTRYRMRKKLDLGEDAELNQFVSEFETIG